jgi:hypothetical protein
MLGPLPLFPLSFFLFFFDKYLYLLYTCYEKNLRGGNMNNRRFTQACETGGSVFGKSGITGKKVSPNHHSISSKTVADVYERYYKEPVSALYQAVKKGR